MRLSYRCDLAWEDLEGDGPARRCDRCDRVVHDLDAMPPAARAHLLGGHAPACVRFLAVGALAALAGPVAASPDEPGPGEGPLPVFEDLRAPRVMGTLDRSKIERVIHAGLTEVLAVWSRRVAARPERGGEMVVRYVVEDGAVVEATIARSDVGDPKLEDAVIAAFEEMSFPPGGRYVVQYPVVFASGPSERDADEVSPRTPRRRGP